MEAIRLVPHKAARDHFVDQDGAFSCDTHFGGHRGGDTACAPEGHPDRLVEQDRAFPVGRRGRDPASASRGVQDTGADSPFSRATDLEGNRGGDPGSQIMEDIVKVVYTDVDTFSRAEVHVEPRRSVALRFQCVRESQGMCAHRCCLSCDIVVCEGLVV